VSVLVLTERPLRLWDDERGRARDLSPRTEPVVERDHGVGEGLTLADVLASAWDGLGAHTTVACPVCHGELEPRATGAGGRCRSCGTTLS
jgi:hypothetical protein